MSAASASETKEAPRFPALTGLRIMAALAVYASHVKAPAGSPSFLSTAFFSGYCGVTIFFVLSGFVLAINYFDEFRRPRGSGLYRYAVARFARIYPLYLLILFYFVVRQHGLGESVDGWWRSALAIQAWDGNLDHAYAFDAPSWSISVEFFLYACFPLLVPLLARLGRPRDVLIATGAIVAGMAALAGWFVFTGAGDLAWQDPGSAHRWLYLMPLTRLGDFALGILAARLYVQTRERQALPRAGLPLVLGAAVAMFAMASWQSLIYTPWSWDLAYAAPAAVLIFGLAIAPLSMPARFLSLPFMVLLGEASYAFYLVHDPAIGFFGAGRWTENGSLTLVVYEALALGAILALAVGLHTIFERPARTYIRRVLAPRKGRPVVPTAASEPVSP